MSATIFTPAVHPSDAASENPAKSQADTQVKVALRTSMRSLVLAAVCIAGSLILMKYIPSDEMVRFAPPESIAVRLALAVLCFCICAYSLLRAALGKLSGRLMIVIGVLTFSYARNSTLIWQNLALAAVGFLAVTTLRLSLRPAVAELPIYAKRSLAAAVWLVLYGCILMSASDMSGVLKQLGSFTLGGLLFTPFSIAVIKKLMALVEAKVHENYKIENLLWLLTLVLLGVNAAIKLLSNSTIPQLTIGSFSTEPFEIARILAVLAFGIDSYRWSNKKGAGRKWIPPLRLLIAPTITVVLYLLIKEKGTLAMTCASFVVIWGTLVGGRSTWAVSLLGAILLILLLILAKERLAVAMGYSDNVQAEAAETISKHPGLLGATGAARPPTFLGVASSADFMMALVAAQGGIAGMLQVLIANTLLFIGLLQIVWRLRPTIGGAIGVTGFVHLLFPVISSLLCFSFSLVIGLPFPFLARSGNHLFIAMFSLGLLFTLGVTKKAVTQVATRKGTERMRLIIVGGLLGMAAASALSVRRIQSGWCQPLSEEERERFLRTPASLPLFYGEVESGDNILLARTIREGNRPKRLYDIEPGLSSLIGAGTTHIQNHGIQANLFNVRNQTGAQHSTMLFGPEEFSPSASPKVKLTINATLSRSVGDLGRQHSITGAVFILRRDGAIESALSLPGYDANRINDAEYLKELNKDLRKPLFKRAFDGAYNCGSTIKPIEAALLADLNLGDTLIQCNGSRCDGIIHGQIDNLETAIQKSCNQWFQTQFRRVSAATWKQKLEDAGMLPLEILGIGMCGDSLPFKKGGVPANWAIGQEWTLHALSLASAYLTIFNQGKPIRPFIVKQLHSRELRPENPDLEVFTAAACARALKGMERALRDGTARSIWQTYKGNQLSGAKTGTAETGKGKPPHALMVAVSSSHIMLVVNEHGGKGASLGAFVGESFNVIEKQ